MNKATQDTVPIRSAEDFTSTFFEPERLQFDVEIGGTSDVGKRRHRNEDHFGIFRFRRSIELLRANIVPAEFGIEEACSYSLVVADGMGGMKSGDLASRLALKTMLDLAMQATSWVMRITDLDSQQVEQRVTAYVQRMHATLRSVAQSDPDHENMGTTWTSAHLLGRFAVIVHLGDSRCYLYRGESLHQITRDDTMAQALIDSGVQPEHVDRLGHILLNCMGGASESAHASIYHFELIPGDRVLLCTDGLTDLVDDDAIAATLEQFPSAQAACDQLVRLALDAGGKDNVTVVTASILGRNAVSL